MVFRGRWLQDKLQIHIKKGWNAIGHKRNGKFYHSPGLKQAEKLVERLHTEGKRKNMVPKAYLQALFWAAQSRLREEKENTGWWAQFLGIKSASSHSLNTCQSRVKYSELATNLPHRQQIQSNYQLRWNLWPGTNDDSKEMGHTRLAPGDPKCTDWRIYWLLPFVFPR